MYMYEDAIWYYVVLSDTMEDYGLFLHATSSRNMLPGRRKMLPWHEACRHILPLGLHLFPWHEIC